MDVTKQKDYDLLPTTPFKSALERTYYYYTSQFKPENLKFTPKELFDKGYYIGTLDEIFENDEELNKCILELEEISKTKKHYRARYDYNIDSEEERYPIGITEEEVKIREEFIKKNNRITTQKWWESQSPEGAFNNIKAYFDGEVEKYLQKIYPESKGVGTSNSNFTLYENGDFITPHRDGFNKWRFCVILIYLSDENKYNDGGGELVIEENGVREIIKPVKGNFCILDFTRNNANHAVNPVKNDFRRFTYINFFQNNFLHDEEMKKNNN
jgi:Rps23 Pro-64 3,4-dihydroxylase Tpa1-like proline 4-hydroxylase